MGAVSPALCALVALTLAAPVGAAPCAGSAACLALLERAQAATETVDARFVQTKHVTLLEAPLVSTGRFRFRRPDRVRLDIESPQPSTILIAGRAVTIPGLAASEQRALAGSPMTAMFTELGALFAGRLGAAPAHFEVAARSAGDDAIEVTLTPTAPDFQRLFRTIALRFAGPQPVIHSLRLDDALGDRLEVELRDVQINVALPESLFTTP